jgi:hypothetical protein
MRVNPFEQRSRIMDRQVNLGMFGEQLEERPVRQAMALLHHVIEISQRLMGVQEQRKMEFIGHCFYPTIGVAFAVL